MRSGCFFRTKRQSKFCRTGVAAVLVCTTLLAACSNTESLEIWRQVPIQMARATQTDSYRQIFLLGNGNASNPETMTADQRRAYDERMDRTFIKLIGSRNWQHMKNLYGVSSIREELISQQIHMEGLVSFSVYLDPLNHDYVIMEGTGRFFAVRQKTGIILMSGDFHVTPQRYRISDFRKGCIPMEAATYTTRIPGKPTYYNNSIIHYDLRIKTVGSDGKAFSVDYDSDHKAYLDMNNDGRYEGSELFAMLKLDPRYSQAKLLDLRGIGFIRNDYDIDGKTRSQAEQAAMDDKGRKCVNY